MLQLSYLMELAKLEESQRSVMTVAQICGVNHSAVSKYFKICRERGILADGYQFTAKGERWLSGYQKLLEEVRCYLEKFMKPSQAEKVIGTLPIIVTCSVGRTHMPESTAQLVFYL